jgi:hypothetical protein
VAASGTFASESELLAMLRTMKQRGAASGSGLRYIWEENFSGDENLVREQLSHIRNFFRFPRKKFLTKQDSRKPNFSHS